MSYHTRRHPRRPHGRDAGALPTADQDRARYALLVDPLSPELALVDPELAERARAQLADHREPARRPAPVRQPEPPPQPRPSLARADRAEPVEPPRRWRRNGSAVVAVVALAAGLGGAAAIWLRSDGGASIERRGRSALRHDHDAGPPESPWRLRSAQPRPNANSSAATTGRLPRAGRAEGAARRDRPARPRPAPRRLADAGTPPDGRQPASLAVPARLDRHWRELRLVARRRSAPHRHPRRPPRRVPVGHRL